MDVTRLAALEPADIDEALECMRSALVEFHAARDKRAIFLRLYYIMTLEVHAAVNGLGDYAGRPIFLDPAWVRRLSGRFATLYFRSLSTHERTPPDQEQAWKIAHDTAAAPASTVVLNAVLGINAHINYDLPRAIGRNLDPAELTDYPALQRRKFDHDQVNNLLVRTLDPVQAVLARDYAPGIAIGDHLLGSLDERLSEVGLSHYRERVWWAALMFASTDVAQSDIVCQKLNWESYKIALFVQKQWWLVLGERVLGLPSLMLHQQKPWDRIVLEEPGGVDVAPHTPINIVK